MTKLNDPKFRLNNLYSIIDYKGEKVKMKLNKGQQKVLDAFLLHGRIIVLKCRQAGLTTEGAEIATDMFNFISNCSVLITAHNQTLQRLAFGKCRSMYKDLIKDTNDTGEIIENGNSFKLPETEYFTTTEMAGDNGSIVRVALDATGSSINHWHFTEASRNLKAEEVFISAMSALNEGTAIIESTAWGTTGEGKWFYDAWTEAVAGKSGFHPVFIAWFEEDRYEKEYEGRKFPELAEEQRQYLSDYSTDTQNRKLQWYTDMMTIQKGKMQQEFPSTPLQAFLSSGNSVFDINRIGELQGDPLYYDRDEVFGHQPKKVDEGLRIYRDPTECIISIDPAGGNENGDYTAIIVRDFERKLLACYYGKAGPDKTYNIIKRLDELGYIGTVVPEINATNGGSVYTLLDKGIDDRELNSEMYRRQKSAEDVRKGLGTKYGWLTGKNNRKDIIEYMELLFARGVLDEIDDRQLHEMANFYENDNQKKIASDGEHDDLVMCDAINLFVMDDVDSQSVYTSNSDIL